MPHDFGARIGAIKSTVAHAVHAAARKVRGQEPRTGDKKLLRQSSKIDTKKVRLDVDEKKIKADVEKMLRAERVANYPIGKPEEMVRFLAMKPKPKERDAIRQSILGHGEKLVAAALERAGSFHTVSDVVRRDLGECLKSYNSRQLKTIIRNAVQANAPTGVDIKDWQLGAEEIERARLAMKLVVEACLDRLSEKKKYSPLQKFLPKTDHVEIVFAYRRWIRRPAYKIVEAIRRGEPPHVLQGFIQVLRPGYKAFGYGKIRSALVEDFRAANSWSHDKVIEDIGRRAAALKEVATTQDLYVTALVMEEVYKTYHLAEMARSASLPLAMVHLEAAPPPQPTAEDRQWAHDYLRSKHPSAAKAAPTEAQPIAGKTRQVARWLLEALAKDDIATATLALKAFVTLGWPGDLLKAEFRTALDEGNDFPDCGKQIARLYRIAEKKGEGPIQHAADVKRAALFLIEAYKANTGRDPLASDSRFDQAALDSYGRILNDKRRETFAEIYRYLQRTDITDKSREIDELKSREMDELKSREMDELIEQLQPSQLLKQIDDILNDSEDDEVIGPQVAAVTDLPEIQFQNGIYWDNTNDLLGSTRLRDTFWQRPPLLVHPQRDIPQVVDWDGGDDRSSKGAA
jgi:hypothetical protein